MTHIGSVFHDHSVSRFGFDFGATLVFTIVAIVSLIESTGVYHALSEITGRKLERKDFRKGYTAEGLAIILGSIFNAFLIQLIRKT